jgi:hypothetical protein
VGKSVLCRWLIVGWLLSCGASAVHAQATGADAFATVCKREVQQPSDDTLVHRGAYCQKSEPFPYVIIDENNAESGRVEIEAYAYSDNALKGLSWPLKFRFKTRLVSGSGVGLLIKPVIDCGPACTVSPTAGMPLSIGGLSQELVVTLTPNMSGESLFEFNPSIRYRVVKSGESFEDGPSAENVGAGYVPRIRCDVGLAKKGTQGCVYPEAPAIMTSVKTDNPEVDESAIHIREAQAAGRPGKYVPPTDGNVKPAFGSRELTRLRDEQARKQNREASKTQCVAQYGKVTGQCDFTGDPDETPTKCDCDEYPFAATNQGAHGNEFSVKRIDASDNRRAGGLLGCFLASQRVLDGETFYIDVEPQGTKGTAPDECDLNNP